MTQFILIHGSFGDASDWGPTLHAMNTLGVDNIHAWVLPGHDGKELPAHNAFDAMVEALVETLQKQRTPTILVGYSLGGRVALHALRALEQRGNHPVVQLVLEGANPGISDEEARKQRRTLDAERAERLRGQPIEDFLDDWYQQAFFGDVATNAELRRHLIAQRATRIHAKHAARCMEECSPGLVPDLWPELHAFQTPLAFIHGEHDQRYARIADEMQRKNPRIQSYTVPYAGHNTHRAQPYIFAQTLNQISTALRRSTERRTQQNRDVKAEKPVSGQQHVPVTNENIKQHTVTLQTGASTLHLSPTVDTLPILFQSPPFIALYKFSGQLVHNSAFAGPRETTLIELAEARKDGRVFPLHRIDRGTSGLILAVDTQEQTQRWMEKLHHPDCVREYVAIVRGHLPHSMRIERDIPNDSGAALASKSVVQVLAHAPEARLSLVHLRIFTGRRHQIRRHMRSIGHPVVGDANWGDSRFNRAMRSEHGIDRLALHAWRICLPRENDAPLDLCVTPDPSFERHCRTLFNFEDWETLATRPPLTEDATYIYGSSDEKPRPAVPSTPSRETP